MSLDSTERRYQVFISSTFRDLEDERKKVLEAVLELRAFPAGMELFPSADDDQWEFIKREIDSSDYYVVIIAGKYGSTAPDGLSYTEKEYDYAKETGKQIIAFLVKKLGDLKGKNLESDQNLRDKLIKFHEKAKGSKLVKFFSNGDDLKSTVLMSLVHSFQMKPAEGWVRARNARRIEDLEELTALQKKVMSLEKEIEGLRALESSEAAKLAHGRDIFKWTVKFESRETRTPQLDPPVSELCIEAMWDQFLLACFIYGFPKSELTDVKSGLVALIRPRIKKQYPGPWIDSFSDQDVEQRNMFNLLGKVRIQLLGLGYIEVEDVLEPQDDPFGATTSGFYKPPPIKRQYWKLTSRGALRCALLGGTKREETTIPLD